MLKPDMKAKFIHIWLPCRIIKLDLLLGRLVNNASHSTKQEALLRAIVAQLDPGLKLN